MKKIRGIVVSSKSEKTALVEVIRRAAHPLYHKFQTFKKKYAVHNEIGAKQGDLVEIAETRPISKTKRWKVVKVINK